MAVDFTSRIISIKNEDSCPDNSKNDNKTSQNMKKHEEIWIIKFVLSMTLNGISCWYSSSVDHGSVL